MSKITVTSPLIPDLKILNTYLEDIWDKKWLTNNGHYHKVLEQKLCDFLGVKYISLFSNGTLALITALQALKIEGEVITTPYSFIATSHAIVWNKLKPVFVDIDEKTLNIDPKKIEEAITDKTAAILPVHVYGTPCDIKQIRNIAQKHNLKVIYDAAHAFNVKQNDESILNEGDLSILSFHATKVFSTIEGGAIICNSKEMKTHIDHLKNFGFEDETHIVEVGINGKMNEVQAAYGLANLDIIENSILSRKRFANCYKQLLSGTTGIDYLEQDIDVQWNYSYFPIFVRQEYHMTRDELYEKLKENNIFGRRYFYPLISSFEPYSSLKSATNENLPIAYKTSLEVICLPLHHELTEEIIENICSIIKS